MSPALLDEVHRLIERRRWRFAITGSSARKLRRSGVNLLAGRARTLTMHPLTAAELGSRFDLTHSLRYGQKGPLDAHEEIDGAAIETLVLQELRATNDHHDLGYTLHYWRTRDGKEVDFVLYGERGLVAIEVKRAQTFRDADAAALRLFASDYPAARCVLLYGGTREYMDRNVRILPLASALPRLAEVIG